MSETRWKIIGRGKAGWHAKAVNVTSSGGDINPGVYWTGARTSGYAEDAEEGALVYDARDSDDAAFTKLVISGPMCEPRLAPDAVQRWCEPEPGREFTSLDYVGIAVYRRLLATVPGVRFGVIRAGVVVWDDGLPTTRHSWEPEPKKP